MTARAHWIIVAAVTTALASCAGLPGAGTRPTGPARFDASWPAKTRGYDEVYDDWARSARVVRDYDRVLDVVAVFKAPEWRAAHLARRAKLESLPADEVQRLAEAERAADADYYEVQLLVATYSHEQNDLQKGQDSVWRLALVDDQGNEVRPISVKRDRRPRSVIEQYYPGLDDFHQVYIVRFPKTVDLLRSDARSFSLEMAGPVARVEMTWVRK